MRSKSYLGRFVETTLILAIFAVFIFIRLPVFPRPFGTEFHGDKYATYLPTVINMYEQKNPFLNHNPGQFPITNTNPNYTTPTFGNFPIVPWSILPFMPLTNFFSLEVVIRSIQTVYGVLLLSIIYLILRKLFFKPIALTSLALLVVNPVIQLGTLITVQDLPALAFLFMALYSYLCGHENLAFLLTGLSALAKYSFLLINLPLFAVLIFLTNLLDRTQLNRKLYELGKLMILSLSPLGLYPPLIKNTPSDPFTIALTKLLIFVVGLTLIYLLTQEYENKIKQRVTSWNLPMLFGGVSLLGLIALGLLWSKITGYAGNFLTDRYLILNWPMYKELLRQIGNLAGSKHFKAIVLVSLVAALVKPFRRMDNKARFSQASILVVAIFLASLTYLIIASKSIFFHTYYRHLFIILFIFALAFLLQVWQDQVKDRLALWLLLGSILIVMLPPQTTASRHILLTNGTPVSIRAVGAFLEENLDPTDKVIGPRILNVYAPHRTTRNADDISVEALNNSLSSHTLKYYFISLETIDIEGFMNLVHNKNPSFLSERSKKILQLTTNLNNIDDHSLPPQVNISNLNLETRVGKWYIYSIR